MERLYLSDPIHINRLMMLLAHELAHDEDTRGSHIHGPDFYEHQIRILESNYSPTVLNCTFYDAIRRSRIEERRAKEKMRKTKKEAEIEKKLQRKREKISVVAA